MFPPGFTHKRLYPSWGLFATLRRTFHGFPRLTHQLPRDLAHHFRFRVIVDSGSELQGVPAVLFAIGAPHAGSEINPSIFTQPYACGVLPAPGGQAHTVLFRG